ncbi:MAG TPA: very short patch repair endonuclease [Pyrinomonadaceae bacterium]|nr:very short patch repair endonuclease [Pyrinomonadaceae bacterium]
MPDVVDPQTRSRMMSGIRGKDTRPELVLRRALHRLGFRYRLHVPSLPGKPDMVFPKQRAIIQVHGCFWHLHDCHLFKWPSSRVAFWRSKITRNREKDAETFYALTHAGWRILTVWECAFKGKTRRTEDEVVSYAADWLVSGSGNMTLQGRTDGRSC